MKKIAFILICMVSFCKALGAHDICGFWKSINDDTGNAQCIIAVYEYQGRCYGRIVATCDKNGKINDSIYAPIERAPGVAGNPFYAGLDLLWNLRDRGARFKGKVIDPEKGGIYTAEVWVDEKNLIVRGQLLIFGRSVTWFPTTSADFPKDFKMPDVTQFVPVIPESD